MPASPNIRFQGDYGKTNGGFVTIKIIDKNYTGSVNDFTIDMSSGLELFNNTDEKYIYNSIDTKHARLSIINNSANVNSFVEDLKIADEGRFFLQINEGGSLLFIGKIISDEMTIQDIPEPTITITAIDCITDLKNIEYNNTDVYGNLLSIILFCLNKLENSFFYNTSEAFLLFQSNLIADTSYSFLEPLKMIYVNNYFYKIENKAKKYLSCYDVLKELCGRLNLKLSYEKGIFNLLGNEGITEDRIGGYLYYNKLGTLVTATSPANPILDITDYALAGGSYIYNAGFNEVQLNINKEYTNRFYGSGILKQLKQPFPNTIPYYELGTILQNTDYVVKIKNNVYDASADGLRPNDFIIRFTIRTTNLQTSAITTTDYDKVFSFFKGEYLHEIKLDNTSGDKLVEVQAYILSFNPSTGTNIKVTCDLNILLTKEKETDTTYFKASINNKNVKKKLLNNLASDKYGKDEVKFKIWNGSFANPFDLVTGWKFNAADSFVGLEAAITKNILSNLRNNTEILKIGINVKPEFTIDNLRYYSYKSKNYKLISYSRNILLDLMQCTFQYVATPNKTGIVNTEDIPAVDGVTSNYNTNVSNITSSSIIEVNNVVTNNVVLNYPIPSDATFTSIQNSIDVFVEGVRWLHVQTIGNKRNCYTVNAATKTFTFSRGLDGANVIFKINKNFVSGETF